MKLFMLACMCNRCKHLNIYIRTWTLKSNGKLLSESLQIALKFSPHLILIFCSVFPKLPNILTLSSKICNLVLLDILHYNSNYLYHTQSRYMNIFAHICGKLQSKSHHDCTWITGTTVSGNTVTCPHFFFLLHHDMPRYATCLGILFSLG